jgi:hypothetical protein
VGPPAPPRPSERKRRFQIIKLEERIAPGHGHGVVSRAYSCNKHCAYSVE